MSLFYQSMILFLKWWKWASIIIYLCVTLILFSSHHSSQGRFCQSITASRTWSYSGCLNVWVSLCPFGSETNCTTPAGADKNLHEENHGRTLLHIGELRARVRQEPKEDWPLSPSLLRTGSDRGDGPITLSVWMKPSESECPSTSLWELVVDLYGFTDMEMGVTWLDSFKKTSRVV